MNWYGWALLSAVFAGLTAVLAKVGVKDVDSNLAMAIRTTVVVVLAWAVAAFRSSQSMTEVPGSAWLYLVLSGLATGGSWLCYFMALKLGDVSRVAPIDKFSLVIAMGLAMLFLGERLTGQQWVGAALIVAGVLVLAFE
jgi:transporter family protein